jgi:hypothetical protein
MVTTDERQTSVCEALELLHSGHKNANRNRDQNTESILCPYKPK